MLSDANWVLAALLTTHAAPHAWVARQHLATRANRQEAGAVRCQTSARTGPEH
jgi:hypothetical protein